MYRSVRDEPLVSAAIRPSEPHVGAPPPCTDRKQCPPPPAARLRSGEPPPAARLRPGEPPPAADGNSAADGGGEAGPAAFDRIVSPSPDQQSVPARWLEEAIRPASSVPHRQSADLSEMASMATGDRF